MLRAAGHAVAATLAVLALAAAAAAQGERVIVAFGDSLTAGYGVAPDEAYPGVSGDTTAGGLRRVDWALRLRPEIVLLELGANDALRGHDLTRVRSNLEAMITRFEAGGAKVLLLGMRLPPNYGGRYAGEFARIYEDVARQRKLALMPFFLDGVGAVAALNQPDGIHPTAEGYRIIVDRLWPHLRPLLSR
jgi:acyl-CoA thioesterase-1